MKRSRLFALLLTLCLVFTMLPAQVLAAETTDGGQLTKTISWSFNAKTETLTISGTGAMESLAFAPWYNYRDQIKHLVYEEGITAMASNYTPELRALETVSLPSTLQSIPGGAFIGCRNLKGIVIPENVQSIGMNAFAMCDSLTELTIPASVKQLDMWAFSGMSALKKVTFQGDAPSFGENVFADVTATVYYPAVNKTWTEGVLQQYGGELTWVKNCASHTYKRNVCTVCGQLKLQITQQPTDVFVRKGETAAVTVKTTSAGTLTYKWYYKNAGASKFSLTTSFTKNSYSVSMSADRNGRQIYCVITDAYGNSVTTDIVTLYMHQDLKITQQPQTVIAQKGKKASVSLKAQGTGITYKWYYKNILEEEFTHTDSYTSNTYSVTMTEDRNQRQVYCVVTDVYGNSVKSDTVTLHMHKELKLLDPLESTYAFEGSYALINVHAEGTGLSYKWYFKNAGASKFSYTATFDSYWYEAIMNKSRDGRQVYCVVTDLYGNSIQTNVATLYMHRDFAIIKQPVSVTVEKGQKAAVTVQAEGMALSYKWYYKDPGAAEFKLTTAYTGNTYSVSMSEARSGRQLYCEITDYFGDTLTTDIVTINMKPEVKPVQIVTQPKSVTVAYGAKAKVTVDATGEGLKYQWYYKDAGASKFSLTTSFTGNSYSVVMNAARMDRQVYCVVTDQYGNSVQSETVTLGMEVQELRIVKYPPSKITGKLYETVAATVDVEGTGLTYEWFYLDAGETQYKLDPDATSDTYVFVLSEAVPYRRVYCRITDVLGRRVQTPGTVFTA